MWKQEERKWTKDDLVTYETDDKDLDLAIAVFREEDRSDRVGMHIRTVGQGRRSR